MCGIGDRSWRWRFKLIDNSERNLIPPCPLVTLHGATMTTAATADIDRAGTREY
jgi:hypothetical protein